jgi:predicted TIM-barrel fold metal-dependent hydrolase
MTGRETTTVQVLDIHIHVGRREHLTPRFIDYYSQTQDAGRLELLDALTPSVFSDYLAKEAVDKAVILSEYSRQVTGVVPVEYTAGFCRGSERLIPFGSIDLESTVNAAAQTEYAVKELGCRGLKLLPSYGRYYPDDPRIWPAYEVARDLGIPIMFHTGTSVFPGTRVRYSNPLLLDEIADEFTDLVIVMCHGGRPFWYKEAEWMLLRHKNVYIDVSGIPPWQLPQIFPKMEKFPDRFLFGSDWPNVVSIAEQVRQIRDLTLSDSTIRALLWDNAARLLGMG